MSAPLNPNWPVIDEAVALPSNVGSVAPYPYWLSVAQRVINNNKTTRGRQYELDIVQTGEYSVTLDNRDGVFSPLNTASPLAPILPYIPYRKRAQWPPTQNLLTPDQATTGSISVASGTLLTAAPTLQLYSDYDPHAAVVGTAVGIGSYTRCVYAGMSGTETTGRMLLGAQGFTIYPAAAHSFQCVVRVITGTVTVQVQAVIAWVNAAGQPLTSATSATATLTGPTNTWTPLTVSGIAPINAAGASVGARLITNASAGWQFEATGLQVEQAVAPTAWTLPGVWY